MEIHLIVEVAIMVHVNFGRLWVGFRGRSKIQGKVLFVPSGTIPSGIDRMNRTVGSRDLLNHRGEVTNASESALLMRFACKVDFRVHEAGNGGKVTVSPHSQQYHL